jgi:hypothetical protein
MQNAERERLIRQMAAAPGQRAAVIAKAIVCVGAIAVLVVAGVQAPKYVPTEAGVSASPSVAAAQTDVRAETHRKHVFDARRQYAAERDLASGGQDIERQARMAYVAP